MSEQRSLSGIRRRKARGKTWMLKIRVSKVWIDDGFTLDGLRGKDRCRRIADTLLPYSSDGEISVQVVNTRAKR